MKLPEFWKTGALLLVLAGLGSYIWFVERKQEPKREGEREKVTVLTVDKAKAKELSLAAASGEPIRVVKEGSAWKVTSPFTAPADTSAVESMLTSLEKVEADEVVAERAANPAEFGLDKPSRTVTAVVDGAKAPLKIEFGAKSPDGSSVYARTASSPRVYLLASWVEGSFDKKPFDLRDRDLLHVKRDDVRSMEVAGPEGAYALARTDAGEWAFTKPVATRAGRWSVDGLLGTIENLRMDSVAAEAATEVKAYGLDKPTRTVSLVLKDGSTRSLEIGAPAPDPTATPSPSPSPSPSPAKKGEKPKPPEKPKPTKYYARQAGTGLVAVVPATVADDLAKGMGELRAKRLLEVATYETEGFEAVAGGAKKTYAKTTTKDKDGFDKTQWKRTAPDAKDLETTKVEDALFKMGSVEVSEFVDQPQALAAYGLDAPVLKVTVKAKGESWIEVGKKDGAVYARRNGDAAVLKLDATKAEELLKAFGEL
ncbi:MAG TPA: DUF4340 domain-containing protein [Vicinamibacteria bacterium]|nr:DUF4340 domain-containing protein [Vicinamibacteria bacterium]